MSTPEEPSIEDEENQPVSETDDRSAEGDEQTSLSEFDRDELTTLVTELRSENRRLRADYARAKQRVYQRSSIALLVLGALGVLAGIAFPAARDVLFILGSTGLFAGVLTRYLTPEEFVPATMGRSVYETVAETGARLRDELGLNGASVYVPTPESGSTGVPVRLFVPQSSDVTPPVDELTSLFVLPESTDQRGISLRPTAAGLVAEFDTSADLSSATGPDDRVAQLVDALVEQFELAEQAIPEVDTDNRRATVRVEGGPYGTDAGFDHPVSSFLGTGLALGFDRPVTVETTEDGEWLVVTCQW